MSRFLARVYGRAGPPEVVQEALADLKNTENGRFCTQNMKKTGPIFLSMVENVEKVFRAKKISPSGLF